LLIVDKFWIFENFFDMPVGLLCARIVDCLDQQVIDGCNIATEQRVFYVVSNNITLVTLFIGLFIYKKICRRGCGSGGAVSLVGVVPTWTVGASASIIFPCSIKSRRQEVGKPSLNAVQPFAKAEGRVFLLVPAYPGCPRTKAVKRLLLFLLLLLQSTTNLYL